LGSFTAAPETSTNDSAVADFDRAGHDVTVVSLPDAGVCQKSPSGL